MTRRGTALVLVGMSVSDVDRRDELVAAAAGHDASVAFLQMGDPSLARELTRLFSAEAVLFQSRPIRATLSVGIASYPTHGSSPAELIRAADLALYQAKARGRNQVVIAADQEPA